MIPSYLSPRLEVYFWFWINLNIPIVRVYFVLLFIFISNFRVCILFLHKREEKYYYRILYWQITYCLWNKCIDAKNDSDKHKDLENLLINRPPNYVPHSLPCNDKIKFLKIISNERAEIEWIVKLVLSIWLTISMKIILHQIKCLYIDLFPT